LTAFGGRLRMDAGARGETGSIDVFAQLARAVPVGFSGAAIGARQLSGES
jgi:hypothetical protein